jgi:hypothetical protein
VTEAPRRNADSSYLGYVQPYRREIPTNFLRFWLRARPLLLEPDVSLLFDGCSLGAPFRHWE